MSSADKVVAYVLLVTDSNRSQQIYEDLKNFEKVKECNMIYGDYDIILKVELSNLAEMTAFMMEIRHQFAIKKSSTLITLADTK